MLDIESRRLDHLGLIKGLIDELGVIDIVNEVIPPDPREEINAGQVVAAMVCNGLGFVSKPLSLTPEFFESKPVALLFGDNVEADMFNASKLSRVLDKLYAYGLEALFALIASKVATKLEVDMTFQSLDTTSVSVTGEYNRDTDEHCVKITHGHSKDHRSDLKQVIVELMVSQDGGVPLMLKLFNGNASDNTVFKERCDSLVENLQAGSWDERCLVADSKLYHQKNAENLSKILFITRVPNSIKEVQNVIAESCQNSNWTSRQIMHQNISYIQHNILHYGIEQRWLVSRSEDSELRSNKRVDKAVKKEKMVLEKMTALMQKGKFCCETDATTQAKDAIKKLKYHKATELKVISKGRYKNKGKPAKGQEPDYFEYSVEPKFELQMSKVEKEKREGACIVIATNQSTEKLSDVDAIMRYKKQNEAIENTGFRFLKDPLFFTQSLFVKRADRIESTLFIMTLSLLVYSIGQRQIRGALVEADESIPDQMKRPTKLPTLRRIFQLFEGINWIKAKIGSETKIMIENVRDSAKKVITLLGEPILRYYPGCIYTKLVT